MSEIIKTEHLTFSYPPDEGKEPSPALAGVDLTSAQPIQDALDVFGQVIEELEELTK